MLGTLAGALLLVSMVRLVKSRMGKVLAADTQLASYQANKEIFAQEATSLAAIKQKVETLAGYEITSDTIPQLLSSMEALAQRDAIDFSITTVQTPGNGSKQQLLIDFSAKGTQKNLDAFLGDLTHQSYQIAFTKLSLFAESDTSFGTGAAGNTSTLPPPGGWDVLASIRVMSY
ncbi:MAG TPA: hypothetical protein VG621_01280 [Candidatus Paceibacterota bacterium]|nr:hypothetical protein [Candidatus Paceibacterota bacterium]